MRVVAFNLSGCPAGWLGAYGNEWVGTPNLDQLAAEGVVFDRHISDRPEFGALRGAARLNELLHSAGVRTVLVRANHPDTDGPDTYYAGWSEVFDARPDAADHSPLDALIRSLPQVLDRLQAEPRWLLWIETDRLIPPWDVPQEVFEAYIEDPDAEDVEEADEEEEDEDDEPDEDDEEEEEDAAEPESEPVEPVTPFADPPTGPFDTSDFAAWEWLHRTFAAVVTALDAELGRIFDVLRTRGLDQTAAWLVTSDFGYPLGEHGQVGLHRPWLHEELVHLPLMLRLPGAAEAGRRVWAFTQPPDLASTLLNLFGIDPLPHTVPGFNLLPLAHGTVEKVRDEATTSLKLNGATELAIRTDDWALLLPITLHPDDPPREPLLFAKPDDRWEVNDLRVRNIETADELEGKLRRFTAENAKNAEEE